MNHPRSASTLSSAADLQQQYPRSASALYSATDCSTTEVLQSIRRPTVRTTLQAVRSKQSPTIRQTSTLPRIAHGIKARSKQYPRSASTLQCQALVPYSATEASYEQSRTIRQASSTLPYNYSVTKLVRYHGTGINPRSSSRTQYPLPRSASSPSQRHGSTQLIPFIQFSLP